MSEEMKNPAQQPEEQPAEETKAETGAAPEENAEQEPKKHGKEKKKDLAAELEAAKAQAQAAETALNAAKDQLLRTAAEYENFRKRSAREQDAAFNNGVGFAVSQILAILDTLDMAANAPTTDENYKKGVLMTLDKAAAAFKVLKVEEIPALGLPFDPEVHSAVMQQPAAEGQESGTVVQVFQKGYKLGDKVVRHATVVVAE
ncbi:MULTISPECIES: nucleotide exchange factor GrpE [Eubacteriales]|uniref:nucleotide exchange factor GrpE n=1 Tax=Eubacteriales TaxID=186802 RepID=UPI000B36F064|nr:MULTISPECIES: nucleotide exchange factor GrpE [Eubacteriales]MDY4167971.1 nucleotide exchange factor GrpE [Fournierella sp.]OUN86818.1 nucleotide exchange factor GrpE [Gemmiger sp. An50]